MTNNKIQMPANFVALNENEMSCVEGGGIVSQICYAFGRMFRSTYYDNWESESKTLEQSHGAVVSKKNGVYTYSDGYTHTMSGGSNWGFTSLGDLRSCENSQLLKRKRFFQFFYCIASSD